MLRPNIEARRQMLVVCRVPALLVGFAAVTTVVDEPAAAIEVGVSAGAGIRTPSREERANELPEATDGDFVRVEPKRAHGRGTGLVRVHVAVVLAKEAASDHVVRRPAVGGPADAAS